MLWSKPFVAGLLLAGTGLLFGIWIIVNNLYAASSGFFYFSNTPTSKIGMTHSMLVYLSARLLHVAAWALSTIIGLVAYSNQQANPTSAWAAVIGAWTISWAALNVNFQGTYEGIENRDNGEQPSFKDTVCNIARNTDNECQHVRAVGGMSALLLVAMAVYLIYVIFNWIHIAFMGGAQPANPEPKVEDRKHGRYSTYIASVLVVAGFFIRQVGLTRVVRDLSSSEVNLWGNLVITGTDAEVYQTIGVVAALVASIHFFAPAAHYHPNRMSNKALWSIGFAASTYVLMTSIPATIYDSRALTSSRIFRPSATAATVCDASTLPCDYYRLIVAGEWLVVFAVACIFFALVFSAIKATPFAAAEQSSEAETLGLFEKVYSGLLLAAMVGVVTVWEVTIFIASVTADADLVSLTSVGSGAGQGIFNYTYLSWLLFLVHFLLWVYYLQSKRTTPVVAASFLGQLACLATWVAWVYPNMYNFSTTTTSYTTTHATLCPQNNESFSVDKDNMMCYLTSGTAVWSVLQGFAQILMTVQLIIPFFKKFLSIGEQKLHFLQWILLLSSIATVAGLIIGAVPFFKIIPDKDFGTTGMLGVVYDGILNLGSFGNFNPVNLNLVRIPWGFGVVAVVSGAALAFAGTDTDASGRWVSVAEAANWGATLVFWAVFPAISYAVKNHAGGFSGISNRDATSAPCDGVGQGDALCNEWGSVSSGFGIVAIATGVSALLISFMRFTRVNNINATPASSA